MSFAHCGEQFLKKVASGGKSIAQDSYDWLVGKVSD